MLSGAGCGEAATRPASAQAEPSGSSDTTPSYNSAFVADASGACEAPGTAPATPASTATPSKLTSASVPPLGNTALLEARCRHSVTSATPNAVPSPRPMFSSPPPTAAERDGIAPMIAALFAGMNTPSPSPNTPSSTAIKTSP